MFVTLSPYQAVIEANPEGPKRLEGRQLRDSA